MLGVSPCQASAMGRRERERAYEVEVGVGPARMPPYHHDATACAVNQSFIMCLWLLLVQWNGNCISFLLFFFLSLRSGCLLVPGEKNKLAIKLRFDICILNKRESNRSRRQGHPSCHEKSETASGPCQARSFCCNLQPYSLLMICSCKDKYVLIPINKRMSAPKMLISCRIYSRGFVWLL